MGFKQDMLATIKGDNCKHIPYVPRLDLWYRANKLAKTLPAKYEHASLSRILADHNMGFHAVIPDFQDLRSPDDDVDRGLGIYNLHMMPYRTVLHNVHRNVDRKKDRTKIRYQTPYGDITTTVLFNDEMRKAGITLTHIEEHAIKNVDAYRSLGYIFDNAEVIPNYDGYLKFADKIGDQGVAVGFASLAASPMQLIQRELIYLEKFFFELYDHPDELHLLAEKIGIYWNRLLQVIKASPAELVLLGANYDTSVTYPPFFKKYIKPWLKKWAAELHQKGKYLLTHTDGENDGLLQYYVDAKIDVADSICPQPMTRLTFKQVRDTFNGKITIMGGIPSVIFLSDSYSDIDFERYMDNFFKEIGDGKYLIMGISDTTPPAAEFSRIIRAGQLIDEFGLLE
ncbi:hypothetical protein GF337_04700 [candidate division KSB1 bacterium]|nr:hypothetical protein [candidate division KSB1 bacterium]